MGVASHVVFLQRLKDEIRRRNPGMMTPIGVAITAAYIA